MNTCDVGDGWVWQDAGSSLASLVGDESSGSLLSLMKAKGVAEGVGAGVDPSLEGFGLFSIRWEPSRSFPSLARLTLIGPRCLD